MTVKISVMDSRTGADHVIGEGSTVYLRTSGVRVSVMAGGGEARITVDHDWSEEERVNAIETSEVYVSGSQARLKVKGVQR